MVENVGAFVGDGLQSAGVISPYDQSSDRWRGTARQENLGAGREFGKVRLGCADDVDQILAGRKTVFSVAYGGLNDGLQTQPAVFLLGVTPSHKRARNANGAVSYVVGSVHCFHIVGPIIGDCAEHIRSRGLWSNGIVVDIDELARIAVVEINESSAEYADHHGFNDCQCERRGDGCVDSIAAHCQHFESGRRRHRMVGRHHASGRHSSLFVCIKGAAGVVFPRV